MSYTFAPKLNRTASGREQAEAARGMRDLRERGDERQASAAFDLCMSDEHSDGLHSSLRPECYRCRR